MSILLRKIASCIALLMILTNYTHAKLADKIYTPSPLVASLLNSIIGNYKPEVVLTMDYDLVKRNSLYITDQRCNHYGGDNVYLIDDIKNFDDRFLDYTLAIDDVNGEDKPHNVSYQYSPSYVSRVATNIKNLLVNFYPAKAGRFMANHQKWQRDLNRALLIARNKISAKQNHEFYGRGVDLAYFANYFALNGYRGWYSATTPRRGCIFLPHEIIADTYYPDYIKKMAQDLRKCM